MQAWCGLGYEEAVAAHIQYFVSQYHADCTEELNIIITKTTIIITIALIIFIPLPVIMTNKN